MKEVELFLENNEKINEALQELKYKDYYIIKELPNYTDYYYQYIENNSYKIKNNVLLDGCIIKPQIYTRYRIESNEFLGTRLIIYYSKGVCNIM